MGTLVDLKITIVSQNWKTYIKFNIINIYIIVIVTIECQNFLKFLTKLKCFKAKS